MWHDIKKELPIEGTWCLLQCIDCNDELYYRTAKYAPNDDPNSPWLIEKGHYFDGKTVLKWSGIVEYVIGVAQAESPYRTLNTSKWQDRLGIEYYQLSDRIEKLEKALNMFEWKDEDALKLMYEQRDYMLKYKDVLFRRICHYDIKLYKEEE